MEVSVSTTIEEKVEITLPYYSKGRCFAFAVLDEETAIQINHGLESSLSIQVCNVNLPFFGAIQCTQCSREVFYKTYDEVELKIKGILLPNLLEIPQS